MTSFDHVFDCSRIKNDTEPGDESVNIYTPHNIGYIARVDAIAIAKFYKLTTSELTPEGTTTVR